MNLDKVKFRSQSSTEVPNIEKKLEKHLDTPVPSFEGIRYVDPTYPLNLIAHVAYAARFIHWHDSLKEKNIIEVGFGSKESDVSLPIFAKEEANVLGIEISAGAINMAQSMGVQANCIELDTPEGVKIVRDFAPNVICSCRTFEISSFVLGEESEPEDITQLMSLLQSPASLRMQMSEEEALQKIKKIFELISTHTDPGTIQVHTTTQPFSLHESQLILMGYQVFLLNAHNEFIPAPYVSVFVKE